MSEQTAALQKRLNQLVAAEKSEKAMPDDLKDETRAKKIQGAIRDCKINIAKLQPPAKRRAELEEELRKAEGYIKLQKEQIDKREKDARAELEKCEGRKKELEPKMEQVIELKKQIDAAKLEEGIAMQASGKHIIDPTVTALLETLGEESDLPSGLKALLEETRLANKRMEEAWRSFQEDRKTITEAPRET